MSEAKLRVNCFVNDGRKENGRRAVLNTRWHWNTCLKKVAEKVDAEYTQKSLLYTADGVVVEDADELMDGETVFYAPGGEMFVSPTQGGGAGGAAAASGGRRRGEGTARV